MIFVDTGAWFASIVPWDAHHAAAKQWLAGNQEVLCTTDFVIDETLTLLRIRKEDERARTLGQKMFSNQLSQVYFLSEEDVRETWKVFQQFKDKEWSFTDCSCKVVLEKLGLTTAFSFDQHFRQFGNAKMVP